jgi:protein arginine N-methyltransferase 1
MRAERNESLLTYSLSGYSAMIADDVRRSAYESALRETVKPGSVVVDIGTGTGYFAVYACKLGARRVYAIEPDATALAVARETAKLNNVADRIEFIPDVSTVVQLPEQADVVVADLRGVLPLNGYAIAALSDARKRLLKKGGALIPLRDSLYAVPVCAPDLRQRHVTPWSSAGNTVNVRNWLNYSSNRWVKARVDPSAFIAEPVLLGTLDYMTREDSAFTSEASWVVKGTRVTHGFIVWFDAALTESVGFSCDPRAREALYGSAYFPLREEECLEDGDEVRFNLRANLVNGTYIWRWNTELESQNGTARRFQQSDLFSRPLDPKQMSHARSDHRPQLAESGVVMQRALAMMDGTHSLENISASLADMFPNQFDGQRAAADYVAELSMKFSRG